MARGDIGSAVDLASGFAPQSAEASTINGDAIARGTAGSCVLFHAAGAATGTPTTQTVASKVQESVDGVSGWSDVAGAAPDDLTADGESSEVNVNLVAVAGAFLRVVTTVSFTGGTSPAIPVAAVLVLGGSRTYPI